VEGHKGHPTGFAVRDTVLAQNVTGFMLRNGSASFDSAHVRPMQPAMIGKAFLRVALLQP
jgi:hypothetical protein